MKSAKLTVNPWPEPVGSPEVVPGPLGDDVHARFRADLSLIATGHLAGWIEVSVTDGMAICTGLHLVMPEIDAAFLRSVAVSELVALAVAESHRRVRSQSGVLTGPDPRKRHRATAAVRRSPDYLVDVARLYREALASEPPMPPAKVIAKALHCAPNTARQYVRQARAAGLLPPTTKGRARA